MSKNTTIIKHKQDIKKMFRDRGIHVTVNHGIDENSDPSVGFHVIVRRKPIKSSKTKTPISYAEACDMMWNYAYRISFKD